jgi:hypothetical protein
LTTGTGLFAVSPRFRFTFRSAWLLASRSVRSWSLLATAGASRTLGSRPARTNSSSYPSFASNATEQSRLGLFDDFDFSVVAMYAEVGEGAIGRLFD